MLIGDVDDNKLFELSLDDGVAPGIADGCMANLHFAKPWVARNGIKKVSGGGSQMTVFLA